jgi:hypothetical protein
MTHNLLNILQKASGREFEPATSCTANTTITTAVTNGLCWNTLSHIFNYIRTSSILFQKEEQLGVEPQTCLRTQSAATTEPLNTM